MPQQPPDPRDPFDAFFGFLLFGWTDRLPKAIRPWAVTIVAGLFVAGYLCWKVSVRDTP